MRAAGKLARKVRVKFPHTPDLVPSEHPIMETQGRKISPLLTSSSRTRGVAKAVCCERVSKLMELTGAHQIAS